MPDYRFYVVEADGHIKRRPHEAEYAYDEAALANFDAISEQLPLGGSVEVWSGTRFVARWHHPSSRKGKDGSDGGMRSHP